MANPTQTYDLHAMQQDAVRRAQEMHRQVTASQEAPNPPPVPSPQSLLAQLGLDTEQAMILLLLWMLLQEQKDYKLLLALCYLLV